MSTKAHQPLDYAQDRKSRKAMATGQRKPASATDDSFRFSIREDELSSSATRRSTRVSIPASDSVTSRRPDERRLPRVCVRAARTYSRVAEKVVDGRTEGQMGGREPRRVSRSLLRSSNEESSRVPARRSARSVSTRPAVGQHGESESARRWPLLHRPRSRARARLRRERERGATAV